VKPRGKADDTARSDMRKRVKLCILSNVLVMTNQDMHTFKNSLLVVESMKSRSTT
jgi:hypothetical protein